MILVTGASGKTGRAIVAQLAKNWHRVRGWVRRPDLLIEGVTDLFVGDMENRSNWEQALDGVDKIYHICPNMHPQEVEIGRMMLSHANQAGIKQLVYHSVLHPQIEAMPHHWHKMLVEEMIFASSVPFTIVQPTAYMQNLLPQLESVKRDGILRLPYPAASPISLVDLNDVAQAAAIILASERVFGATLELVGTEPLRQTDIARMLGDRFGRHVAFYETPLDEWAVANRHLPSYMRETLLAMFRYYAQHGLVGNPAVLKMVLGRKPTSFKAWCSVSQF